MRTFGPLHVLILAVVVLLLFAKGGDLRRPVRFPDRLFEGLNSSSAFGLAGALLFALALVVDVYHDQWSLGPGALPLSTALAVLGAASLIMALVSAWRSKRR